MMRFLERRRVLAGGAVLAVGLALTGCAASPPGAAAVVGSATIDESTVADQMRAVNVAVGKQPDEASPQLAIAIVNQDVTNVLVQQTAAELKATVATGQVDQQLAALVKQAGGQQQLELNAAQQGVGPGEIRNAIMQSMLVAAIAAKLAPGASQQQAIPLVQKAVIVQAQKIGVTVAPKYGQWDTTQLAIGPIQNPVSATGASAQPQSTTQQVPQGQTGQQGEPQTVEPTAPPSP